METKKGRGGVGEMPRGNAKQGQVGQTDHCSVGGPIGKQTGASDPLSPSCGRAGNFEGGGGSRNRLPAEKNYSKNGL